MVQGLLGGDGLVRGIEGRLAAAVRPEIIVLDKERRGCPERPRQTMARGRYVGRKIRQHTLMGELRQCVDPSLPRAVRQCRRGRMGPQPGLEVSN